MCGIAGIWHFSEGAVQQEKLKKFTDSLYHRGPDAGGYWINSKGNLGLGHRRLSILDLSVNGNQPMSYAEDRYKIVYNGEVFNFLELKIELEAKGYKFYTASDTEIILAAYNCWGVKCLDKFNGMWAFAIWDQENEKLFIARDRFGVKPLHYLNIQNKFFAFASETYSFRFLDGYNRRFNDNNLAWNIADTFCLEAKGHTIYENIFQLLPGHYAEIKEENGGVEIKQQVWWKTELNSVKVPESYDEQVEAFRALFFDAVKLRLRSDVPIASALSGGLDSSSVYCSVYHIMNSAKNNERAAGNWQKAFMATFPGTKNDESSYAKEVVEFIGGEANFLTPDFTNLTQQIINSTVLFDSIYLTPLVSATDVYKSMYKENIKVSMDGHGVDEMLFGYPGMLNDLVKHNSNGDLAAYNKKEVAEIILNMYAAEDRAAIAEGLEKDIYGEQSQTTGQKIGKLRQETIRAIKKTLRENVGIFKIKSLAYKKDLPALSSYRIDTVDMNITDSVPYNSFHSDILPAILRNFDRSSMQSSIEIRMPFMDYRLVNFVFSLPFESKAGNGFTKRILRDAMKGYLPENVRTRTWKVGFNAPMIEWFSGELSEFILDETHSQKFNQSTIWDGKFMKRFAEKRIKNKSWTHADCVQFWPVLNAHILSTNNA